MLEERATVSIREFQAADSDVQLQLIPRRPGLYIWTHRIGRLLGADVPTVQSHLDEVLKVAGREREQMIKPYYTVKIQDARHRIHDKKRIRLHSLMNEQAERGRWVAELATTVQRPLYVGMTLNLNRRIGEHLSGYHSDLRKRLTNAKPMSVDMLDLAVTWIAAPGPAQPDPPTDDDADAATDENQDDADVEDEDADVFVEHEVGSEIDLDLKAAESLLIRLAMPLFNEKQD